MRFARQTVCVAALLTVAACKSDKKSEDVLAQDSTLNRDLAMANQDTTVRPQLKDVPVATAPVAPTPPPAPPREVVKPRHVPPPPPRDRAPAPPMVAPAPPSPPPVTTSSGNTVTPAVSGNSEGKVGTVPAGTTLSMAAGQQVCTNTNKVGDRFTAALSEAVTASNGAVLPAGATVVLEVTSLQPSQHAGDDVVIGMVAKSVSFGGKTYPLNGEITSAQTQQVKANNNDAKKVAGGAAIGGLLGAILGGRSRVAGAVIGAAGGAAAGAVVAHQTAKYDGCIPSGGSITVRLDQSMQIQAVGVGSGGI